MLKTNKTAFTLIELLIVITIIGILAVALVPKIASGPARARDISRKASISTIAGALELYYADNASYPIQTGCTTTTSTFATKMAPYFDGATVPTDPDSSIKLGNCTNTFYYSSSASTSNKYYVCAQLENAGTGTGYYSNYTGTMTPILTGGTPSKYYCVVK